MGGNGFVKAFGGGRNVDSEYKPLVGKVGEIAVDGGKAYVGELFPHRHINIPCGGVVAPLAYFLEYIGALPCVPLHFHPSLLTAIIVISIAFI